MNKLLGAAETREMSVFDVKALLIMEIAISWILQDVDHFESVTYRNAESYLISGQSNYSYSNIVFDVVLGKW